jgi:DNA polymerase-3 subunit alpha
MTTQGEMVPIDEIFHQGWELVQVSETMNYSIRS